MSLATRNLITATAAICKMDSDAREQLLLTILESNPASVISAMKLNDVSFGDEAKGTTYKVVLDSHTTNKICLIKAFREAQGAGLADSKGWSEGETYHGCPAGTFATGLSREEADRRADEMNRNATSNHMSQGYSMSPTGIKVKVIRDTEPHDYRSLVNWIVDKTGVIPKPAF